MEQAAAQEGQKKEERDLPSGCIVLLCGLPGAGKSTLARSLHQVSIPTPGCKSSPCLVVTWRIVEPGVGKYRERVYKDDSESVGVRGSSS